MILDVEVAEVTVEERTVEALVVLESTVGGYFVDLVDVLL